MYARVARFEEFDSSRIDEQVADMRRQLAAARSGDLPEGRSGAGPHADGDGGPLRPVDREQGTAIAIAFCATEDDARRADAALNEMSPGEGEGCRTAPADIYEVVLDEPLA